MRPTGVVLDTNVLVSGLINSFGPPGRVVDLVLRGDFIVAYDDRILAEWRDVLCREKFGFTSESVVVLLNFIEAEGQKVTPRPLTARLPVPDDAPFLEVASAANMPLVTGNVKHYPTVARGEVEVMTPRDFIDQWTAG